MPHLKDQDCNTKSIKHQVGLKTGILKGKQQTFIFSDPDPDDLNQLVHKGENGEDNSKCDRCDHP